MTSQILMLQNISVNGITTIDLHWMLGCSINTNNKTQKCKNIVKGFIAFEGILRGTEVTIHIYHLNLLYKNLPFQRMVQWQLLFKEFHPTFKHVAGVKNIASDAMSRFEMVHKASKEINWGHPNR